MKIHSEVSVPFRSLRTLFERSRTRPHELLLEDLVLRVSIPCPRSVMTTLPQADLPHDPRILRTLADRNRLDLGDFGYLPCAGVYADVVEPGSIRRGDRVQLSD